jgi:hypothetical protein
MDTAWFQIQSEDRQPYQLNHGQSLDGDIARTSRPCLRDPGTENQTIDHQRRVEQSFWEKGVDVGV